ncbi:transcriptional repressor LexA [Eubacteriales bacterium OttesenSCG-928-N13]|nr:transcriptional repressor LexA [Eubacteriales bacterium OttesenSCG-928-N13]
MRDRGLESQNRILEFIKQEIQLKGYPPSVREICDAVHLKSTSTVHGHLIELEKRGMIRRDSTKPRAMEVLDNPLSRGRSVPLVGRVTAGVPILAEQNIEDYMVLPQDLLGHDDVFALRVEGESMINAGILDGDFVVVRQQEDAENGEIVVAMIEDEATVKRIYKEKKHIRLQPENSSMDPIFADNVDVLGKVVALVRRFD